MITVYTTNTCPYCPMVKKYLQYKNVPYEEVNITNDTETRSRLAKETGMMTVPITTDGKEFVVGYNLPALTKLIS